MRKKNEEWGTVVYEKRVLSAISPEQNVPTSFGSSVKEFSVEDIFERISKNFESLWILDDDGIVVIYIFTLIYT